MHDNALRTRRLSVHLKEREAAYLKKGVVERIDAASGDTRRDLTAARSARAAVHVLALSVRVDMNFTHRALRLLLVRFGPDIPLKKIFALLRALVLSSASPQTTEATGERHLHIERTIAC